MPLLFSINNYYYQRGGSEAVYFEHNKLMEEAGWSVIPFSMHNARNEPSPWSENFVDETDDGSGSALAKIKRAGKAIYSFEAARRMRRLLKARRPDVAHAHNIYHHLSPSVLVELRRAGVPVVLTLHDLKLACPAYKMHNADGICEECRGGAIRKVIENRCIKGSRAMSALVWLETTLHSALRLYEKNVDRFVVPSAFFKAKFAEWGLDTSRFVHIPNCIDATRFAPASDAGEAHLFVYCGRLVAEKGVHTLIRAAAKARVRLRIVGTGPEEDALKALARELGGAVEFTGYLSGDALRQAVVSARAVVIPSEWYENAPLSVMEASALGRPVIGARIGGIPELVRPDTGFLFESGNVDSLAAILTEVDGLDDATLQRLGSRGRDWMRTEFTPGIYKNRMLHLYEELGVRALRLA